MNSLMKFESQEVEVFEWNGQVLFNPYDVGACLDISKSNIRNYTSEMNKKQVVKLTNSDVHSMDTRNSNVDSTDIRKLNNAGENFLTESGVYKLIFKSRKPNAEKFQDWVTDEVLPTLRKTGTYTVHKIPFKEQVECIGIIADMLRVNDASKVLMLNKLYESNSLPTEFLPQYVSNGNRTLKTATELLKVFNLGMNAKNFNVLLRRNGFLEEKTRLSTKGDEKKFNALTEEGLKYGENLINPFNQKEVQPMYYADTFQDLFKQVV